MSKLQMIGIALGALLLVAAVGGGAMLLLREETGCDSLVSSRAEGPENVQHRLVVELLGNTTEWQTEVASFVSSELAVSGELDPSVPLLVDISFVQDGKTARASTACFQDRLVLAPAAGDLATYKEGSEATRAITLEGMRSTRSKQIAWVVDAVRLEVSRTDLAKLEREPVVTPLAVWAQATKPGLDPDQTTFVSIFSPMASTAADCLDASTSTASATELVGDCIAFEQLAVIAADHTQVALAAAANPTRSQQASGERMLEALCAVATVDGCSRPQLATDGE